jgi:hypothetical protein
VSRKPWESDGDEWQGAPEEAGEPPRAVWFPTLGRLHRLACPKCEARNLERKKVGLPPLPQRFTVRSRDIAVWCYWHDQYFRAESPDSVIRYRTR